MFRLKATEPSEKEIKKSIMQWLLYQPCCMAWVNKSVGTFDPRKGKFISAHEFGWRNGVADILGIWRGRPLAIEVKSRKGKASETQEKFLAEFKAAGGISVLARSIQDVVTALRDHDQRQTLLTSGSPSQDRSPQ